MMQKTTSGGFGGGHYQAMDAQVERMLDRFFSDEKIWKQVLHEVREVTSNKKIHASSDNADMNDCLFKVVVPKPYPGVQYRKSKNLDDRYKRFAENNARVRGRVEDNGEWLKIGRDVYLPMRVGAVQILEPVPRKPRKNAQAEQSPTFWTCCMGSNNGEAVN